MFSGNSTHSIQAPSPLDQIRSVVNILENRGFISDMTEIHDAQLRELQKPKRYYDLKKKKRKNNVIKQLLTSFAGIKEDQGNAYYSLKESLQQLWTMEYSSPGFFRTRTGRVMNKYYHDLQDLKYCLEDLKAVSVIEESEESEESSGLVEEVTKLSSPLSQTPFVSFFETSVEKGVKKEANENVDLQVNEAIYAKLNQLLAVPKAFPASQSFNFRALLTHMNNQLTDKNSAKKIFKHILIQLYGVYPEESCALLCLCLQDTITFFRTLKPPFNYLKDILCIFSDQYQTKIAKALRKARQTILDQQVPALINSAERKSYSDFLVKFRQVNELKSKRVCLALIGFYVKDDQLTFADFYEYVRHFHANMSEKLLWKDFTFIANALLHRGDRVVTLVDTNPEDSDNTYNRLLVLSNLLDSPHEEYATLLKNLRVDDPVIGGIKDFMIGFYETNSQKINRNNHSFSEFFQKLSNSASEPKNGSITVKYS